MYTWLHVCLIFYGCRGQQINHKVSQLHFSSSRCAHVSSTLTQVFLGEFLGRQGYLVYVEVCLLSELNEKAGWWIYLGYFKKLLPCHRVAKCSANSFPIMLSVCLVNWPQMPGFYKEKYIFSAAVCLASPESGVIIYLICSPNKLLTLIFVSQHVFSWFVIESQSGQIVVELELPLLLYSQCLLDFSSPLHSENHWVPFQKTPGAFTTFQIFFLFLSLSFFFFGHM